MTISSISVSVATAKLAVDFSPRIQTERSAEAPNPKRFPIFRSTSTESDGTRVTKITYSDKSTETKTEKPIKAGIEINTGRLNILV